MRYELFNVYSNGSGDYIAEFSGHICFIIDSKGNDYIVASSIKTLNGRQYRKVNKTTIPEFVKEKIRVIQNSKEQFRIKFRYVGEDGFWKTGEEYIDVNCQKQDERMHEYATEDFLKEFSTKYKSLEIVSVVYC